LDLKKQSPGGHGATRTWPGALSTLNVVQNSPWFEPSASDFAEDGHRGRIERHFLGAKRQDDCRSKRLIWNSLDGNNWSTAPERAQVNQRVTH